jgi:hypothetical protein
LRLLEHAQMTKRASKTARLPTLISEVAPS